MACPGPPKERKKGPLLITSWRATNACNYSCIYCNVNANMKPSHDELDTEWGLKLVDQIYEFGSQWFGIKGGEPLVRKDLFTLIAHAKDLGLDVLLLTNGYYVKGEILKQLTKYDVYTSISIDGSEQVNDSLRGKGSYQAALSAIKKLSKNGILNGLSMAITNRNLNEADHIVGLAEKYHARFVWFNHLVPTGRAKHNLDLEPTPEQYEVFLNHLYDLSHKEYKVDFDFNIHCPHYLRIYKERDPEGFCEWFSKTKTATCIYFLFGGYLSVLENGDVIPCFYSEREDLTIGNIKEKPLTELWDEMQKSEFYKKLQNPDNLEGKCGVCEHRQICGGCRTRAHSLTGSYFGSDPACAYIPEVLRKK
ncbi:MAG: radical SAM protein [Candidatus Bathyarchaeota archaeon]